MTYDTEKAKAGRKPIRYLSVYPKFCVKEYGKSSTNYLLQSQTFASSTWLKTSVNVLGGSLIGVDGAVSAISVQDNSISVLGEIHQAIQSYAVANSYTISLYIKKFSADNIPAIELVFSGSTTETNRIQVDTDTGNFSTSYASSSTNANVESYGDWWRVWITAKSTDASNTVGTVYYYPSYAATVSGGSDVTLNGDSVIWGALANIGTTPTHYVITTTTTATTQCTASGGSGSECYNTYNTCQDKSNFVGIEKRHRFVEKTAESLVDIDGIPCITSISTSHTAIMPGGKTTGNRAMMKIKVVDLPHHDRGVDPYVSTRSYTPESQGTYFGKFKQRYKYFSNVRAILTTGYLASTFSDANFKDRIYFLDVFAGPLDGGGYEFTAHDIIKQLSDERKTVPELTQGTLTADLAAATTSNFTISGDVDKYATSNGSVRINKEVIEYTTGTDNGDGTFTFSTLTRGVDNTVAADHDTDDVVQKCIKFSSVKPGTLANLLYVTYGGISTIFLDSWVAISDIWLQKAYTRRLTKPTGINQLLSEIHQQMGFFTWYDEEDSKIKLDAIRPPDYNTISTYKESELIIRDSLRLPENPDKRKTRVDIHYNPANSVEFDSKEDYRNQVEVIDSAAESGNEWGDARTLTILAAWITASSAASTIAGRLSARLRDIPREIRFLADAKDESLKTGDQFYLEFDNGSVQDEAGAAGTLLLQVLQRDEIESGKIYGYRCWELLYSGRYAFISPASTPNYSLATEAQKNAYGFIAAAGGTDFSDGGAAYKIV